MILRYAGWEERFFALRLTFGEIRHMEGYAMPKEEPSGPFSGEDCAKSQ
jgi:hypothetical protein